MVSLVFQRLSARVELLIYQRVALKKPSNLGGCGGSTGGLRPAAVQREVAELQDSWIMADVLDVFIYIYVWLIMVNNGESMDNI